MKKIPSKSSIVFDSKISQFILKAVLGLIYPIFIIKEIVTAVQVYQKHSFALTLAVMVVSLFVTHFFYKIQIRLLINN